MIVVDLGDIDACDCEPVAAALEQFTPLAEALRPGLHAFGARGPSRYFGGERALAELVARAAAKAVPSASRAGVGVADGLFAAGLAARAASRTSGTSTARAPAAETFAAEGSGAGHSVSTAVVVVPPQQGRQFLAGLPLISLSDPVSPLHSGEDGTEALLDVLWRLGIRTLGDLAALSEADVLGRFGWPGLLAHRLACGLDDRPLQAESRPRRLGRCRSGDRPARRPDRDRGVHGQGAGRRRGGPAGPLRPGLRVHRHRGRVRQRSCQQPPLAPRAPLQRGGHRRQSPLAA